MILNAYAVLDGFVGLLRLGLGLLVLALGLSAWRTWARHPPGPRAGKPWKTAATSSTCWPACCSA
jgi:hypothetical protein